VLMAWSFSSWGKNKPEREHIASHHARQAF
jgi:hypothetical protein